MLTVGTEAPAFALPGSDGESIDTYRLSEYTDAGNAVVLLFYPFDFSPVCTEELCEFRDSEWLTFTDGLQVFGVSTDSAFAHRAVIQENDLPFPLLSDHDGATSAAYDSLYDGLEGHPGVAKRSVYVVDGDRRVRYAWQSDEWTTDPDIRAVYGAVQELDELAV